MAKISTAEAAALAGMRPGAFRGFAARARAAGVELHAPRRAWPDARTPLWDTDAIRRHLAARPGRGRVRAS